MCSHMYLILILLSVFISLFVAIKRGAFCKNSHRTNDPEFRYSEGEHAECLRCNTIYTVTIEDINNSIDRHTYFNRMIFKHSGYKSQITNDGNVVGLGCPHIAMRIKEQHELLIERALLK